MSRRFNLRGDGSSGGGGTVYVNVPGPTVYVDVPVSLGSVIPVLAASSAVLWTNQPAADTEFLGNLNRRVPANLAGCTQIRILASGAAVGHTIAELRGKYSLDGGATWAYFDGVDGPKVSIASLATTVATLPSPWVTIPVAARGEVILAVWGINGNGVADPSFTYVAFGVR